MTNEYNIMDNKNNDIPAVVVVNAATAASPPNEKSELLLPTKKQQPQQQQENLLPLSTTILVLTLWTSCLIFGLYTAIFYTRTVIWNAFPAWELSDPGMYHEECPVSNWGLLVHLVGGVYIMILGPLQFVKPIRLRQLWLHRWLGRMFLASSFVAACGAMTYLLISGSIMGIHSTLTNMMFFVGVIVSGIMAYYHAAISKNIDQHAKWAWRLASLLLSILLLRFYILFYFFFVPPDDDLDLREDPPLSFIILLYLNFVPNLIFVEIYFKYYRNNNSNNSNKDQKMNGPTTTTNTTTTSTTKIKEWTILFIKIMVILFLVAFTFLFFIGAWYPILKTDVSAYSLSS